METRILAALNAAMELNTIEHLNMLARRVSAARKVRLPTSVLLVKQVMDIDGYNAYYINLSIEVDGYEPECYWLSWGHATVELLGETLRPNAVVEVRSARFYG